MRRSSSQSTAEMLDEADSPVEGLEEGTLAINNTIARNKTGNRQEQNIYRRPQPRFHKEPTNNGRVVVTPPWLTFEIPFARVVTSTTADDHHHHHNPGSVASATSAKRYVAYEINVRQDARSPDGFDHCPPSIERRYTHFLQLFSDLKRTHPQHMRTVSFPSKVLVGNFSADLIAERSATFERFLDHLIVCDELRNAPAYLYFLQHVEVQLACRLLEQRRHDRAVPLLANSFRLLNRVFTDKTPCVLLLLCRLVAACTTSPLPHVDAERWCELALFRYETVSDADLLVLYVPLLQTCLHLWWQRGRDNAALAERLKRMQQQGVNTRAAVTLTQAIHALDPRTETW